MMGDDDLNLDMTPEQVERLWTELLGPALDGEDDEEFFRLFTQGLDTVGPDG